MKVIFYTDGGYSGLDKFVSRFEKVWKVFKPQSNFFIFDGQKKTRDFVLDLFPQRGEEALKFLLQLRKNAGEKESRYYESKILTCCDGDMGEDDVLICFNLFNEEIIKNLEKSEMGFQKFSLCTTKEKQQANLCEFFPDYTPDEDLDVFLGKFPHPPDLPLMTIDDATVLHLVHLLLSPPPKGVS